MKKTKNRIIRLGEGGGVATELTVSTEVLHRIALGPLERRFWRQFTAQ